jgi:hypothetical protein
MPPGNSTGVALRGRFCDDALLMKGNQIHGAPSGTHAVALIVPLNKFLARVA